MGSDEGGQAGLRLIVPALMFGLVASLLALGILLLPPLPPTGAPVATVRSAVDPDTNASEPVDPLALDLEAALMAQLELPMAEPLPVAVAVEETPELLPLPPTPRPTVSAVAATPPPAWSGPSTFTFVALGVDQRSDRELARTDTIMIGMVDTRAPAVRLISVPRDLVVDIPGYGQDRINTAYVYGEQFKEADGGIGLLRRTIQKNFGVRVDHFGLVDFQCFRTAVDAVGGVTLNVPRAIVDPRYPTEDYGTKLVRFEAGPQRMDGERALEYARTRNADNDFHRIQRQQLIVGALREQFLQLRTLPALPSILGGCRNMRSDLGLREYLDLATTFRALDRSRVSFAAIDETMVVDAVLPTGAAVLLPRWEPIRTLFRESFDPSRSVVRTAPAFGSPVPAWTAASPTPTGSASPASPPPTLSTTPARPTPTATPGMLPVVPPGGVAESPVLLVPPAEIDLTARDPLAPNGS